MKKTIVTTAIIGLMALENSAFASKQPRPLKVEGHLAITCDSILNNIVKSKNKKLAFKSLRILDTYGCTSEFLHTNSKSGFILHAEVLQMSDEYKNEMASKIQALVRGKQARNAINPMIEEYNALKAELGIEGDTLPSGDE